LPPKLTQETSISTSTDLVYSDSLFYGNLEKTPKNYSPVLFVI